MLLALFLVVPFTDKLWPFPGDAIFVPVIDAILIALLWLAVIRRLPCRDAGGGPRSRRGALRRRRRTHRLAHLQPARGIRVPARDTYGALGLAAALLLGLFIIARLVVAAAVLNATLWERRPPAR